MKLANLSFLIMIVTIVMISCSKPVKTTIDESIQNKAEMLLNEELTNCQADSGLIMVMSVKTGEIKSQLQLVKDFSVGKFVRAEENHLKIKGEPGPVLIPLTVLAGLEEVGVNMDFQLDAGNGMYVLNGRTIYDQEVFDKGGYGIITLAECIKNPSFIGTVQFLELAFSGNVDMFENRMQMMSFGLPADSNVFKGVPSFSSKLNAFSVGYYCKTTPLQLLTAYNAFANNGKVVAPIEIPGDTIVINPKMCSDKSLKAVQLVLKDNGAKLMPETPGIVAMKGFSSVKNTYQREIKMSICGYYPAENPEYTCLLVIFRSESPNIDHDLGSSKVNQSGLKVYSKLAKFLMSPKAE